jgi:hypothetical protein
MKIKFLTITSAALLAIGFSIAAGAGSIIDTDVDLIPDMLDNCITDTNGPAAPTLVPNNQVDVDGDGFGIRCDPDYNQDGNVGNGDFNIFFACFNCPPPDGQGAACGTGGGIDLDCTAGIAVPRVDHNQDGGIGVGDFNIFFSHWQGVPGPSCGGPPKGGAVPAAGETDGTGPCGVN